MLAPLHVSALALFVTSLEKLLQEVGAIYFPSSLRIKIVHDCSQLLRTYLHQERAPKLFLKYMRFHFLLLKSLQSGCTRHVFIIPPCRFGQLVYSALELLLGISIIHFKAVFALKFGFLAFYSSLACLVSFLLPQNSLPYLLLSLCDAHIKNYLSKLVTVDDPLSVQIKDAHQGSQFSCINLHIEYHLQLFTKDMWRHRFFLKCLHAHRARHTFVVLLCSKS
mmetsp:Transcript_10660/g.14702  ORF Transcript_10660/g.14702 Transcript_10660/m.14702 type:complete len:222 (-) Transcript_10660:885-1550(-)